jgi:Fe-S cluster biosynthesis and repair protein YggX
MIMRKISDMDKYIPDDLYVPFDSYNDVQVVKKLWNEWKSKDTTKMREKAFNYMQAHHSCKIRMKEVLEKL